MSKSSFEKWIGENTNLSESSISKYSRAINTLSEDFLNGINLYNVTDDVKAKSLIESILRNNSFKDKNYRGNNMYSVALKWYLKYLDTF